MKYTELQQYFKNQKIFSTKDLEIAFWHRYKNNLLNWLKKWYINKITKGRYYFNDKDLTQIEIYHIANRVYEPSYISLEYALNIYNIVPEWVFTITSITTKKTSILKSNIHNFSYRNIKKDYFFWYDILTTKTDGIYYKIATIEKAIIDYFYLNSQIKTKEDLYELRRNIDELKEQIDMKKFNKILLQYKQKSFLNRIKLFISFINSNDRYYHY